MEAHKPSLAQRIWQYRMAYLFLLPSLILLMGFMVVPLIRTFQISLYDWDGLLSPSFIGLDNFKKLLQDATFWLALKNNMIFLVIVTVFTVLLGFLFAVAIERRFKGWKVYKFTFYIPAMISMAVVGMLFQKILEPSYGLLNSFLGMIGLEGWQAAWLGDPDIALYSVIAVTIWQYSGFTMLLFLSGVEGISPEIHDAATIDGVSGLRRITSIIFPLVRRLTLVITMLQIIFSFKVFDIIYVMTRGGPGDASQVLGTYLYKKAFSDYQFGYASSIGVLMAVIVFVFTIFYQKMTSLGEQDAE